jgi:hypothetical protein
MVILDSAGDTVRTLTGPVEAGLHAVEWDLRMNPPYEVEQDEGGFFGAPRGPTVLPGRYTVRLETAGLVMEEPVEVRLDPRVEADRVDLVARQDLLMEGHRLAEPVWQARTRVDALDDQLSEVAELLDESPATSDALVEELDSLRARVDELDDALGDVARWARAASAAEASFTAPTADQRWQVEQAWSTLPGLVEQVNELVGSLVPAFYDGLDRAGVRPDPGTTMEVPRRGGGGVSPAPGEPARSPLRPTGVHR